MAAIALRATPKNKDYSYQPFVSILVPTYNEEKVIEKRMKRDCDGEDRKEVKPWTSSD